MKLKLTAQFIILAIAAIPLAGCYSSNAARNNSISEPSGAQPAGQANNNWQQGMQTIAQNQPTPQAQPAQQSTAPSALAAQPSQNEVVIPLHQETLNVGKKTVGAGQVTIHKRVTTQTVQQPIELRSESVDISREPAGAAPPAQSQAMQNSQPFQESTTTIQLNKEEPVIQKNTIQSGEVVARKNEQTQKSDVTAQVRKEDVQVEKSPDAMVVNQNNPSSMQPITEAAGAQADQSPQQFLPKAYQKTQAEIQLGQLAQQKSQSQDVKQFGQHLADVNQSLNQQVTQLASKKGIQLPNKLDAQHQAIIDRFSNLSGADFDRQFASEQLTMQQNAVNLYQKAANQSADPDVKSFAQNSLGSLRENMQMAQSQTAATEAAGAQTQKQQEQQNQQQDEMKQP